MSEIIKTEAVVLSKFNYGDTSSIATFYTEDSGKLSAIIKGGRSSKSKIGRAVNPINHLQIIFYKKDTRDLQFLSGVEIISHFPRLKENLDSIKFAHAIIELVKNLSPEGEPNKKLFKGIVRILTLIDSSNEKPGILFGRFFLFFIGEIGYKMVLDKCSVCKSGNLVNKNLGYNYDNGLLCEKCSIERMNNYKISPELFYYLVCLNTNNSIGSVKDKTIEDANNFFDTYLKFHIADFKGIQSFKTL